MWQALEFSRYICPYEVKDDSLVISISSSGKVARTIEGVIRANQCGAFTVAITSDAESKLAKVSKGKINISIPDSIGLVPGTQSYHASLLSLYVLAMSLGLENGCIDKETFNKLILNLEKAGDSIRSTAEVNISLVKKYVKAYYSEDSTSKVDMIHVLGSGPNWGTAQFASMKFLESAGFDCVPQGIEEWAHSQYFTTRPGVHTILIVPNGESRYRAMEIMEAISVQDGKKIVIGEDDDIELRRSADIYFPIFDFKGFDEDLSPLVFAIPIEILSMFLSEQLGRIGFGFDEKPWLKEENFRQIYHSKIERMREV